MLGSNYLDRSIGLTQAVALLLASFVIGLVLSVFQLVNVFSAQYQNALALTEEILTLTEGSATSAVWTLDHDLANSLINSVIVLAEVQTVRLTDENGAILAQAEKTPTDRGWLIEWLAGTLVEQPIQGRRQLHVDAGGEIRNVGVLSIALTSTHIAERFVALAVPALLAGVIQTLCVGLVLLWLSSRLVTAPLRRVTAAIAALNPERAADMTLAVPSTHKNNEIGHLLRHTNEMLRRLASVQQQLRELAARDPLTQLPNRMAITDRLEHALSSAARNNTLVAVLFLDLDRFKTINDSLGHDVGDELLTSVANRLTDALRSSDSVGRLGGDEFLIVLEDVQNVDRVAKTVRRITDALSQPFLLGCHEISTAGSVGIAVYPHDGEDANVLMRHADLAMYSAKGSGGSRWHFFAQDMSERAASQLHIETALSKALANGELFLVFQPKIDAKNGRLAGCEALLRWCRDSEPIVADRFIAVAEDTGLIIPIGYWVLEQACLQIQDWEKRFGPTPIAVNVSARQLHEPDFIPRVLATIKRIGVNPRLLELEITETVLISEFEFDFTPLRQLREQGVTLSIDDFGTGYSSLSYLTSLPINALKIDRSFISGPQQSTVILNMIIAMAKALRLKTIAEGIETQDQYARLVAENCDMLQGYAISEPLTADDFEHAFLSAPLGQAHETTMTLR